MTSFLAQVARRLGVSTDVNTDFFGSNLQALRRTRGRFPVKHTIQIRVSTEDVLRLSKDEGTSTDVSCLLNGGVALVQNALYHFDVYLYADDSSYNLQLVTRGTTVDCEVIESQGDNT